MEPNWEEVAAQLRKPTGEMGLVTAEKMNKGNAELYAQLIRELEKISFQDSHILEIGFGNAAYTPEIIEKTKPASFNGVDYSADMVNEAMQLIEKVNFNIPVNFYHADILNWENTKKIDLVFGLNVIYFWEPFEEYIQKIHSMLRKQGYFIIGYRNKQNMLQYPFAAHGFHLWDSEELKNTLQKNGFQHQYESIQILERTAVDGNQYISEDRIGVYRKE